VRNAGSHAVLLMMVKLKNMYENISLHEVPETEELYKIKDCHEQAPRPIYTSILIVCTGVMITFSTSCES